VSAPGAEAMSSTLVDGGSRGANVTAAGHGTRACYVRGCRRPECRYANRAYAARTARLKLYGRWDPYTDAGPVREHIRALSAAGIGWRRAAALAGVPTGVVSKLLYGGSAGRPPTRRVRHRTAARLLAITPAGAALGARTLTGATGTRRRLQALVARGWSQSALARQLGMVPSNVGTLMTRQQVTVATARLVLALYDELWDTPPPEDTRRGRAAASRARNHAAARGWPPPAAWDDDAIDDPAASPAPGWQRRRLTSAELADEVRDLIGQGLSREHAAERLGRTRGCVDKALERNPQAAA